MPYRTTADLPIGTKVLPPHAKEIFLAAFNNAWEEYKDPARRRGKISREDTARRVAWAAVKTKYEKRGEKWSERKL